MLSKLMQKSKGNLCYLTADMIIPNPRQPRRDFDRTELDSLRDSIREVGLLQPITVRRRPDVPCTEINGIRVTAPPYEIVAGERRYRACISLGMTKIPCLITDSIAEINVLSLIENIQRSKLNMFEEATALLELIDRTGIKQAELARQLAITQSCLCNKLRLLRLCDEERSILLKAGLGERHARAFLRVDDAYDRLRLIRRTADRQLSAAETEKMIELYLTARRAVVEPKKPRLIGKISDIKFFYNTIERAIGTLSESGINAECTRSECDGYTEVIIKIQNKKMQTLQ